MILGGWRSHHQAWTAYRKQRENIVKEIDAIPCSANWMQGCKDCCTERDSRLLSILQSMLRGIALSESYHELMHRQQLNEQLARRQMREQAKLRRVA